MQRTRWLVVWFESPGWPSGQRREMWFNSEKEARKVSEKVGGCVSMKTPRYRR